MKEYPGAMQVGVVVGGDIDDPAPDLSGNMKVWSPTEHNPTNYPVGDLPFSPTVEPATKSSQSEFGGVPDLSSMVATMKTSGGPPIIIGRMRDFANPNQAVGGNGNLMMTGLNLYNAWMRGSGMFKVAEIVEKNEGGVPIKRRQNPQEYKPSDMQGLPNHGALYHMAGHRWPQIQGIETAVQHFNAIPTSGMIGQLAGKISSVAGMLKGMKSSDKKKLKEKMPQDVYNALDSMSKMMPEVQSGSTFINDFRVHEETFANNAVELLSQATTIADLQNVLNMLDTNPSLRGVDKLEDLNVNMEGPFGNTTLQISATGQVSTKPSKNYQQAVQAFASFLQNGMAAMGANKGKNMFGTAAPVINDMIQRVHPKTQAKLKQTLEKVHKQTKHTKLSELVQTGGAKMLTESVLSMLS